MIPRDGTIYKSTTEEALVKRRLNKGRSMSWYPNKLIKNR